MIGRSIRQIIPPEYAAEEDLILNRLGAGETIYQETVRLNMEGRRIPVSRSRARLSEMSRVISLAQQKLPAT
jgi:hypothetical protein